MFNCYISFGDCMKKVLLVIFGAVLFGGICAFYVFNNIVKAEEDTEMKFIAFQIGVYSNYDNASKVADRNNGIVVLDSDLYRVYVAILKDEENVRRMKEYFDEICLNYYLKEVFINRNFGDEISTYETMISKSSSDTYNALNKDILNIYKEYI